MKPKYMKTLIMAAVTVVAVLAVVIWVKCSRIDGPVLDIGVEKTKEIAVTPQVVESVRDIGQWEFLKITGEEVIDTVRKLPLWPDDRLVLIFHGSPRIGIDLTDVPDGWVENRNDSLTVTLPQPRLLDARFIDEASTEVFAQRGKWSAADRERMYGAASRRMTARALTAENLERVRKAAVDRFTAVFESLGAAHVEVVFAPESKK